MYSSFFCVYLGSLGTNGVLNLKQHVGMFSVTASIHFKALFVLVLWIIWCSYKHERGEVSIKHNLTLLLLE